MQGWDHTVMLAPTHAYAFFVSNVGPGWAEGPYRLTPTKVFPTMEVNACMHQYEIRAPKNRSFIP